MARNFVAASVAVLALLLCSAASFFGASTTPTPPLLSLLTASSDTHSVPAVPVPRPISLRPSISSERALNALPLWHGRTDEDVMANPPPPFFAHTSFARNTGSLRSTAQFLSNNKIDVSGPKDDYEAMKAQYVDQERRMRRIEKSAIYKIQPGTFDFPAIASAADSTEHHLPLSARQQSPRTFHQKTQSSVVSQRPLKAGPHEHNRAAFVHDSSFYKAANSRIGIAHFDANLASTIQSRTPRLAHDLLHISSSIIRQLRPRRRAVTARPAPVLVSQMQRTSVVTAPVNSLQPLLPASLRHKLLPHDTSFYQAANSRAGIAEFDSQLAKEIQERRPDLSQDLKRISAAILSAPLSSLKPLLPTSAPLARQFAAPKSGLSTSVDELGSLTPLAQKSEKQDVQVVPSVTFEQHNHASDYNRIFQKHSAPKAHFPQQEEAWIHFAASGASFGVETKEQREAVKKVRSLARQYVKENLHDGSNSAIKVASKATAVAPQLVS